MGVTLLGLSGPSRALGASGVRFVHAVPGAGPAQLTATHGGHSRVLARAAFADLSAYFNLRSGPTTLALLPPGTAKPIARIRARLASHRRYTVVALAGERRPALRVYPDARARRGIARVRVIHAAPELGRPDLQLDGRTVARRVRFRQATPYLSVRAGVHRLAAVRPSGTATPILSLRVRLVAGTASTAVVVGSEGRPLRILVGRDDTALKPRRRAPRRGSSGPAHSAPPGGRGAGRSRGSGTRRIGRVWVVRRGDSLWAIAARRVGPGASNAAIWAEVWRLWRRNAGRIATGDPNLIFPGQRLIVG